MAAVAVVFAFVIGAMAWVAAEFAGLFGLVAGVAAFVVFVYGAGAAMRIALDATPTMTVHDDAVVFDRPAMLRRPLRVPVDEVLCAVVREDVQATARAHRPVGPGFLHLDVGPGLPNVALAFRTARPVPEALRFAKGYDGDPFVPRPWGGRRQGVVARVAPMDAEAAAVALGRVVPVRALTAEDLEAMAYPDDVVRRTRRRAARVMGAAVAVTVVLMFAWDFRWVYLLVANVGPIRNFNRMYKTQGREVRDAAPPSLR